MMRSLLKIHLLELKCEFLKMFRLPAYVIPTLAFPLIFYVFFGLAFGTKSSVGATNMASYLIATYGAFGVIGASLFGFGVSVAVERGQGWLQVKRATPMPLSAWFGAKIGMALLFSAIIVAGLALLGIFFGGVHFALTVWPLLFVTLVAGALPFCALGLMIGYFAGPNSAPAIVNVIYLPMSFASGIVDSDRVPAEVRAENRADASTVSLRPARADHHRRGQRIGGRACRRTHRIYAHLPRAGDRRLPPG